MCWSIAASSTGSRAIPTTAPSPPPSSRWRAVSACARWPRASRPRCSKRSCGAWAATLARAFSTRIPYRRPRCKRGYSNAGSSHEHTRHTTAYVRHVSQNRCITARVRHARLTRRGAQTILPARSSSGIAAAKSSRNRSVMGPHYLDSLLAPRAIVVIGASEREGKVGRQVFENLRARGFGGPIYAVIPKHETVLGEVSHPNVGAVCKRVDLAVSATPAAAVPQLIRECGECHVRAAIVLSAGFSEGREGAGLQLEQAVLEAARQYGVRIVGPNCLGLMRPLIGLNATFSKNTALAGDLALVSQSGALCTAILDWATPHHIGFSAMVSLGDAADVDIEDVLEYLALDTHSRSIFFFIECIRHARGFMSGLRAAARLKSVIVVKAGRHGEGARAALSHTGALVGAEDVVDAALARAGAVRATTVEQLFSAAQILASRYRASGPRLVIVTNAGGPGVLATDRAVELDVQLATLTDSTIEQLDRALPAHWSHGNPVDILGDATPERYRAALTACLGDEHVDGVLVMLTPQAMTQPAAAARRPLMKPRAWRMPSI